MDEDGERRVRVKRSCKVDRLSNLPDSLIFEILLKLHTKYVVRTSALSRRWRNLWRYVPGLDLKRCDFSEYDALVSFVDGFLSFNSEACVQNFKLKYNWGTYTKSDVEHVALWINTVVKRKVQHLFILGKIWYSKVLKMPPILYTCESLVSLKFSGLFLASPKFVSLPSLRYMVLNLVQPADDLTLETLISGCPILESLFIHRSSSTADNTKVLRVCSRSLLHFTYISPNYYVESIGKELVVAIDAPMLKYLKLHDGRTATFILNNPASIVQADINIDFDLGSAFGQKLDPNDLTKRNMICDFLVKISSVKHMVITTQTLDVIYDYSRCERLPLFRNLSFLEVEFRDYNWEMLPIFLESCPNLKNLELEFSVDIYTWIYCSESTTYLDRARTNSLCEPRCLLSSLEYVKIVSPLKREAMEMKLLSYLLENSMILKKLTLYLDDSTKNEESAILNELHSMPILSSSFQVVFSDDLQSHSQ